VIVLTMLGCAIAVLCCVAALHGDLLPERWVQPLWHASLAMLGMIWVALLAWLLS
jgi:hypothetical protein